MRYLHGLTKEGEDAWLRLKRHLEWCDHFALVFIFSAHPNVIRVFNERLANIYRARVTLLQPLNPEEPEQLITQTLPELLRPPEYKKASNSPYWLDLSSRMSKEWKNARLNFLLRLNERREILRKAFVQPLILVLPSSELSAIRNAIPDLWSIRHLSLTTGSWIMPEEDRVSAPSTNNPIPIPDIDLEYSQSVIQEWDRVKGKESTDRGILLAGFRAYQAVSALKRYKDSQQIAGSLLNFSRKQIERFGETPESLRDLSVSLNNVSNTARALGELEEARRGYEESLTIRRKIIERFGETFLR